LRDCQSSFSLWHLGFKDVALEVWPYPDNILPLIDQGVDFEYRLELAQKRFNDDPNNPDALEDLAWAHWNAGHNEEALKLAERYLDTLGATRRPIDGTNMMFALDAWQRGDEEAMLERLVGLEARIDQRLASGVDFFWPHFQKAMILQMRGNTRLALEHMEKAVNRTIFSNESLGSFYDRTVCFYDRTVSTCGGHLLRNAERRPAPTSLQYVRARVPAAGAG
jgi:tetratricopeptide (TPR) repeat protein